MIFTMQSVGLSPVGVIFTTARFHLDGSREVGDGKLVHAAPQVTQPQHPVGPSLGRGQIKIGLEILDYFVVFLLKIIEYTPLLVSSRQVRFQLQGLAEVFDLLIGLGAFDSGFGWNIITSPIFGVNLPQTTIISPFVNPFLNENSKNHI